MVPGSEDTNVKAAFFKACMENRQWRAQRALHEMRLLIALKICKPQDLLETRGPALLKFYRVLLGAEPLKSDLLIKWEEKREAIFADQDTAKKIQTYKGPFLAQEWVSAEGMVTELRRLEHKRVCNMGQLAKVIGARPITVSHWISEESAPQLRFVAAWNVNRSQFLQHLNQA
jgi:hypothetical protein